MQIVGYRELRHKKQSSQRNRLGQSRFKRAFGYPDKPNCGDHPSDGGQHVEDYRGEHEYRQSHEFDTLPNQVDEGEKEQNLRQLAEKIAVNDQGWRREATNCKNETRGCVPTQPNPTNFRCCGRGHFRSQGGTMTGYY